MSEMDQSKKVAQDGLKDAFENIRGTLKKFKKASALMFIALFALLVTFWTGWFTVQPEETGIVQRFGKVIGTADPGLHFKIPFGIDTVRLVPTARVLKEEFGFRTLASVPGQKTQYNPGDEYTDESLMLTGDLNVIDVQWIIQYIPQYGIELVDVRIKRFDYVESVREKVYERMISERKRIAAQFRSEGEGLSAEILGTMEKELSNIRSTAYRKVQEIQGMADAEATQIYGLAYNRDPEFCSFLQTLESYKERANPNSVMLLTTKSDFYSYIKSATAPTAEPPTPTLGDSIPMLSSKSQSAETSEIRISCPPINIGT